MNAAETAARTEISCKCKTCAVNAEKLGLALPLRAEVYVTALEKCKGKTHGLVHMAHDPSFPAAWLVSHGYKAIRG